MQLFNQSEVETKVIAARLSRAFLRPTTVACIPALGNACSFSRPWHELCGFASTTDWIILSRPFVLIG